MDASRGPFAIEGGRLVLEGVDLARLAEELAPLDAAWLVGGAAFDAALRQLSSASSAAVAVGRIGPPDLLARAASAGGHAAVCSSHELRLATAAGFPPGRIVAAGPVKDDGFLKDALTAGVGRLQVEGDEEAANVARIAGALGLAVPPSVATPPIAPPDAFDHVGGLLARVLRDGPDLAVDAEWPGGATEVWPLEPGAPTSGTLRGLSAPGGAGAEAVTVHGAVARGDWVVVPSPFAAAPDGAATTHPPLMRALVEGRLWRPLGSRPPAESDGAESAP